MGVTLRSFILSFLLIVSAAVLYRLSSSGGGDNSAEVLQRYPSFSATRFAGDSFDEHGKLVHHLEAQTVTYYKQRSLLTTQRPLGIYYRYSDGSRRPEPWQLTADAGRLILNQEAELTGNVQLVPLFKNSQITKAETSYLHFDLPANLITTPEAVRISGPNFINYGTGLRADLNDRLIHLDDPHATYEFN